MDLSLAGTIRDRATAFGITHASIDSNDVDDVRRWATPLIQAIRVDPKPLVLELEVDRLGPHSKGDDPRPESELAAMRERDWESRYRRQHPAEFEELSRRQKALIESLVAEVSARPLAVPRIAPWESR
jgi:pyruvate dehydrogenase E1 component alpha subunit